MYEIGVSGSSVPERGKSFIKPRDCSKAISYPHIQSLNTASAEQCSLGFRQSCEGLQLKGIKRSSSQEPEELNFFAGFAHLQSYKESAAEPPHVVASFQYLLLAPTLHPSSSITSWTGLSTTISQIFTDCMHNGATATEKIAFATWAMPILVADLLYTSCTSLPQKMSACAPLLKWTWIMEVVFFLHTSPNDLVDMQIAWSRFCQSGQHIHVTCDNNLHWYTQQSSCV